MKVEITNRFTGNIIISGNYASVRDCCKKNKANLDGANLHEVNLDGAKGYVNSHDIFQEVVSRQQVSVFTDAEWSAIAQITIHRLCWASIKKRFSAVMPHIFEVLAQAGFNEWLEYWDNQSKKELKNDRTGIKGEDSQMA